MNKKSALAVLLTLTGCSVSLNYAPISGNSSNGSADPDGMEGTVPFMLRSTTVTLTATQAPASSPAAAGPDAAGVPGKAADAAVAAAPAAASTPGPGFVVFTFGTTNACPTTFLKVDPTNSNTQHSAQCLQQTTATAAPAEATNDDTAAAAPASTASGAAAGSDETTLYQLSYTTRWGTNGNLSVTYLDNSYLISSVGLDYQDNRGTILGNAAAAAAAGFTFGGPIGAGSAAAATLAFESLSESGTRSYAKVIQARLPDFFGNTPAAAPVTPVVKDCNGVAIETKGKPSTLDLPVALTYDKLYRTSLEGSADQKHAGCWMPLPFSKDADSGKVDNAGWYYQFRFTWPTNELIVGNGDAKRPPGTFSARDYFAANSLQFKTAEHTSVPYTPCRSGVLRVAWGADILAVAATPASTVPAASYPLTVGDVRHLRAMTLPPQGTVTMGSVCGASIQAGSGSSTTASSTAAQLFAVAKAIKTGQSTASAASGAAAASAASAAGG